MSSRNIVYDAVSATGYWLYIQRYLQTVAFAADPARASATIHLPMSNLLDEAAIEEFRRYTEVIIKRMEKAINHGED